MVIVVVKNHLKDAAWASFSEPKITSSTLSTSTCFMQEKHTRTATHAHALDVILLNALSVSRLLFVIFRG